MGNFLPVLHLVRYCHFVVSRVNYSDSTRDADRVRLKLRLASGSYIIQSNRVAFIQSEMKVIEKQ